MKKFDLNIEKVLEHWTIPHALREIIANALDESILSNTKDPKIYKDRAGNWHIQDFGRGLQYEHLTQNENLEKTNNEGQIIGQFGVGLKDALATFDRRGVEITIKSAFSDITIERAPKGNFDDVVTLHAIVDDPTHPDMVGIDVIFTGLADEDIETAKGFFLKYSGEKLIEKTKYGTLLEKNKSGASRIYINGIHVADEDNFLFSYNITSLTKKLRKSLNRERTNVGRSAYSDRLKSILLECSSSTFAESLVDDLQRIEYGTAHGELQWIDVQEHACSILNTQEDVLFLTAQELLAGGKYINYAKKDRVRMITIPESLASRLRTNKDRSGNTYGNLDSFVAQWNEEFEFSFINESELSKREKDIFDHRHVIIDWFPKKKDVVKSIVISETMRPDNYTGGDALGLWEEANKRIIINRSQLKNLEAFAGTLVHELVHAYTGTDDCTIEFESELTRMLGKLSGTLIENQGKKKRWLGVLGRR